MVGAERGQRAVRDHAVGNSGARDLELEVQGVLIPDEVGGYPGLQVPSRDQISEAEVERESRPCRPRQTRADSSPLAGRQGAPRRT